MATNTPLQSILLTSSVTSVVFSNIDQNYTDLRIVINGKSSTADTVTIRLNGDSSSSYTRVSMAGNGSATQSNTGGPISYGVCNTYGYMDASNFGYILTLDIHNYSNTSNYKTILCRSGNSGNGLSLLTNLWAKTAAITSITLFTDSGYSYTAGTTFDLYGIKSGAPKASGGDTLTTDGNYWYHTFRSSGTFLLQQPTSVDYLVVAGGGGGGEGGGGAGGLRSTVTATGGGGSLESALSMVPGSYTVTIGAGGTAQGAGGGGGNSTSGSNSIFSTITSTAGGRGGTSKVGSANSGSAGGSGGGAAVTSAGAGTANQGFAGGNGVAGIPGQSTGGGGGAGAVGGTGTSSQAGNGGAGVSVSISGSSVVYGGGGGAGFDANNGGLAGAGGSGGGGAAAAARTTNTATSGTANTGGGGGGGSGITGSEFSGAGGNGGSGIVIVRYAV